MVARDYHEQIWAAVPASSEPEDRRLREEFLASLVAPGQRVLDLGCGAGEFSALLRRVGAVPVAVDVAAEALRRACERVPGLDARLTGSSDALPLDDAEFDAVWAGEVIEHVADTGGWLSEVRRVLAPGGLLMLSTPHHGFARRLALASWPRAWEAHFHPLSDHLRFYTPRSLTRLLSDWGFESVTARSAGGPPLLRRRLLVHARRGRW